MQIVNTLLRSNANNSIYRFIDCLIFIPSVGNLIFTLCINNKYGKEWHRIINTYYFKGTPIKPGTSYADNFKQKT